MTARLSLFAPCPRGVEPLLAEELRRLGVGGVRPQHGGVLFSCPLPDVYRPLLWSRLASRVLLSLGEVAAGDADALYAGIGELAWEDHVRADGTIAVDASGVNDALRNTQFTAVRVKDAIADRFVSRAGVRPSVDTADPDLRINVVVIGSRAKVAIDLSGDPLHRRGYRRPGKQVAAPMKETLAAAMLEVAGWREIVKRGGGFADPLCGSATIAIEAAMVAADMAPGILRSAWGFDRWLGHDEGAWAELLAEADDRCEAGLSDLVPIVATDNDPRAVEIARDCVARAGLSAHVDVRCEPLSQASAPAAAGGTPGLVACNPPYGERLSAASELPALYGELSKVMRERFAGWTLAVITSDPGVVPAIAMDRTRSHDLYNGRILAPVSVFEPSANGAAAVEATAVGGIASTSKPKPSSASAAEQPLVAPDEGAAAFSNRLKKMAKHLGTWARRTGVTCYRVYDADLPDYNVAIDVYTRSEDSERFVHIAEYAPPAEVDTARAAARVEWACASAAEVLGVDPDRVFVKLRSRQRGASQYGRMSRRGVVITVEENGLQFEVNLSDYLDTGLFLDHRDTRAWLRDQASAKRFVNLFAYTGTATVYAAAGGAASTTTVDLSATYLDWAARNMQLNGIAGPQHSRVHGDVLQWVESARAAKDRYDLVFCDPPTFSNSKRMDKTWDVQRDHVELLRAVADLLDEGGRIVFSCNRRKFALDADALALAGLLAEDITARTISKDFERTPGVHSCWIVTRS